MSPRAFRRAAERKTLKLAVKAEKGMAAVASVDAAQPLPEFDFAADEHAALTTNPISDARLAANRANSQLSTGPRSVEGKAKSSLNAVKTGLTGRTVLLSTDDAVIYQQHLDRYFSEFSPATDKEKALVQCIADTEWRLLRIAPLEASIYAIGRRKLADLFADEPDPANREALLQGEIFLTYRKDLTNLALQERRLRSQRKTDIGQLQDLQKERIEKAERLAKENKQPSDFERACKINNNAYRHKLAFLPEEHGFDFSIEEFEAYWKQNDKHRKLTETDLDFDRFLAERRSLAA
jgi:hypothetical protein